MSTVPIPAEIVGDTPTIRARRDDLHREMASAALCLGRQDPLTKQYHLNWIIEHTAAFDRLRDECERRWIARDLAYANEPARMVTR